jgi:hypothetical protein
MTTAGYLSQCEIKNVRLVMAKFVVNFNYAAVFALKDACEYRDLVAASGFNVEMLDYSCVLQ